MLCVLMCLKIGLWYTQLFGMVDLSKYSDRPYLYYYSIKLELLAIRMVAIRARSRLKIIWLYGIKKFVKKIFLKRLFLQLKKPNKVTLLAKSFTIDAYLAEPCKSRDVDLFEFEISFCNKSTSSEK